MLKSTYYLSLTALFLIFLAKIFLAFSVPPLFDEAYYVWWSESLDWGYLDHPPMVALLSVLGNSNSNFFLSRLPSLILAGLTIFPLLNIGRLCTAGKYETQTKLLILLLVFGNLGGLLYGVLTLPDVGLIFFWALTIQEFLRAISGSNNRWITGGICLGLAFLSKYIAILMLAALFFFLLSYRKKLFASRHLWLGFAAFILTISPHLMWNFQNDWASFRFQLNRGFLSSYEKDTNENNLPTVLEEPTFEDQVLASRLIDPLEIERPKIKVPKTAWQKFSRRVSEFMGGILFIWGFMLFVVVHSIFRNRAKSVSMRKDEEAFLLYSALVPIIFFALASTVSRTEANWASIYTVPAGIWIALKYKISVRWISLSAIFHAALAFLLAAHVVYGFGPIKSKRILNETRQFEELTHWISSETNGPLFAERYQIASQLNFFANSKLRIAQFPGLTRDSEWVRKKEFKEVSITDTFNLVGESLPPPSFEGFKLSRMVEFRRCLDKRSQIRSATTTGDEPICRKPNRLDSIFISSYSKK